MIKKLIFKLKPFLKNSRFVREIYSEMTKENNEFIINIPEITPLDVRACEYNERRLNLVVPSINQEHIFGGISTALKFFEALASEAKIKKRIILTDATPSEADLSRFDEYKYTRSEDNCSSYNEIVAFNDRYNKTIPVGKNDLFITTSWWTAYHTHKIIKWQAEYYKQQPKKNVYIIQDYEPGFYSWSSKYVLAENTYKFEYLQIAVFNSSLLRDFFKNKNYNFFKEYVFEPQLNKSLKDILEKSKGKDIKKKKQILIYGRPSVERNAFLLIVEALKRWVWIQPDIKEWTILSLGEKHKDIDLGNSVTLQSRGKLSIDGYAEVLLESSVGVSLMVSPHPSYPPMEMANFGLKVITNEYENKDLSKWHSNIVSLKDLNPETIADSLKVLCNNFLIDDRDFIKDENFVNFYCANLEQFSFVKEIVKLI